MWKIIQIYHGKLLSPVGVISPVGARESCVLGGTDLVSQVGGDVVLVVRPEIFADVRLQTSRVSVIARVCLFQFSPVRHFVVNRLTFAGHFPILRFTQAGRIPGAIAQVIFLFRVGS